MYFDGQFFVYEFSTLGPVIVYVRNLRFLSWYLEKYGNVGNILIELSDFDAHEVV